MIRLNTRFVSVANSAYSKTALAALLVQGASAHAALDITEVTAKIAEAVVAVSTIGLAVLTLMVGIKAFKWVRAAIA